jgi:hypothetical protein
MHSLVFDMLPPQNKEAIHGQPRVFLLVIDESVSLPTVLKHLDDIGRNSRPTDQVGLITFGAAVTLFHLNAKRGSAFTEFDLSLYFKRSEQPFFVNALIGVPAIISAVKSLRGMEYNMGNQLNNALLWAVSQMEGYGGRLLLFTKSPADFNHDLLSCLHRNSISLCVIEELNASGLAKFAEATGGIVCSIGNVSLVSSLFSLESAWDTCATLRVSPTVKISSVLGSCSQVSDDVILFPVITSSESIIYELSSATQNAGQFHFQLSLRFTDDQGVRKVRVINGRVPFVDVIRLPIDEAALALYLNRKRLVEQRDELFASRVVLTRQLLLGDSRLAQLVYGRMYHGRAFVMAAAVEKFALANLVTEIAYRGRTFRVLWAPTMTVVFPRPEAEELEAIMAATKHLGFESLGFYCPESEPEFVRMVVDQEAAESWYRTIPGIAAEERAKYS